LCQHFRENFQTSNVMSQLNAAGFEQKSVATGEPLSARSIAAASSEQKPVATGAPLNARSLAASPKQRQQSANPSRRTSAQAARMKIQFH
jgi:hypothetical protein